MHKYIAAFVVATFVLSIISLGILTKVILDDQSRIDRLRSAVERIADDQYDRFQTVGDAYAQQATDFNQTAADLDQKAGTLTAASDRALQSAVALQASHTMLAWSVLTSGTAGDLGKSQALMHVLSQGHEVNGLDLSCPNRSGHDCLAAVRLNDLVITDARLADVQLGHVRMANVSLKNVDLDKAAMDRAELYVSVNGGRWSNVSAQNIHWGVTAGRTSVTRASFENTDFTGATLVLLSFNDTSLSRVSFDHALLEFVDFKAARIYSASFVGAGLSGVDFTHVAVWGDVDFTDAWAWEDQAPTGIDLSQVALCTYSGPDASSGPVRRQARPLGC